ncbi:hypothetical protein EN814_24045 [Mesorhizobium sp. M2D.F.Ca.ET.171.01.1.1]|uniref:hypothetical protein n=1 Tax=unclassified Mesorhizobium TaxID=325217 RepID=UPI0010925574|nr:MULTISPECIES: hypothetical protein [unclassified Mesorhizobium]TGS92715.1 hypothetical protein EN821_24060 [Mesorhizobium sp. M2D.F.Ca.ET.178.01.1.1]TGT08520.1 hypothetical protein EN814_24045 [Mesorhizobium sp. M2D.F.Ca.ET.171.01.1.1]
MKASGFAHEAAYSVFEALRPVRDQALDRLALATYSLDLVAIAALILSLSKVGEQELEAGPLSFVDALEAIAPRIDVVHQKDRLRTTERHFGVLHMLDRRLHAIQPPRGASYHPKLALARYVGPGTRVTWKLWIGSRNLTGGHDREAGLLLVGRGEAGRGTLLPEIAEMAAGLLAPVLWVGAHFAELAALRWQGPSDAKLRGVQWRRAGEDKPFTTSFPRAELTVAISPFVDDDGCRAFDGSGEGRLLTTELSARGLSAANSVPILIAGHPLINSPMPVDPPAPTIGRETIELPDPPGLHAKLLLRQRGARARLWIGSANLTGRGMNGPNAEVLAELDVPVSVANELIGFVDRHPAIEVGTVDTIEVALRAAARALDNAAETVLEARFTLWSDEKGLHLGTDDLLDTFLADHHLSAWLFTRPDQVVKWPAGTQAVLLVPGGVPLKLETVLVCFEAARLAGDCPPRCWAQVVMFPGHDPDARDQAATAAYIGLSGASAWLRAQLEGIVPTEPTTWTGARRWVGSEHAGAVESLPLTLEEVLAAWARNPSQFEARALGLGATLAALGDELGKTAEQGSDVEAIARWQEVERFWDVIRKAVGANDDT